MPDEITPRLELALSAAEEAGRITLQYFQQEFHVERKADNSPVTVADREAEQLLRRRIGDAFANDAIVGEEFPTKEGSSGYRWILDPIDGTKSFICGVPLYGTLVGVEHQDQSVIGVIHIPALEEWVYAVQGKGAWHRQGGGDPRPARVGDCPKLAEGTFLTSQVDSFGPRGAAEVYEKLQEKAYITRNWGDCYGYLLIATGRAAVMVDPVMNVWDAAPLLPILQEAGGTFTDWQGRPTIHAGEGIATNGQVLEEVLSITRPFAGAS